MVEFNYTHGTKREVIASETIETDFYNLKNKADGARRYGFTLTVLRFSNLEGQIAFVGEMQATLNGSRYQSSKDVRWLATADDAMAAARKMVAGSLKRYERLAADPVKNKIEKR